MIPVAVSYDVSLVIQDVNWTYMKHCAQGLSLLDLDMFSLAGFVVTLDIQNIADTFPQEIIIKDTKTTPCLNVFIYGFE